MITANAEKAAKALMIAKTVFMIILTITGITLIYFVFKKIYDLFLKPKDQIVGTDEYANKVNTETKQKAKEEQEKKGLKLTYDKTYYVDLATQMHRLMDAATNATYAEMYPLATKMRNYLDIMELDSAFGYRDYGFGIKKSIDLTDSIEKYTEDRFKIFWREYKRAIMSKKSLYKK